MKPLEYRHLETRIDDGHSRFGGKHLNVYLIHSYL